MSSNVSVIPDDVQEIGRIAYQVATDLQSGATVLDTSVAQPKMASDMIDAVYTCK